MLGSIKHRIIYLLLTIILVFGLCSCSPTGLQQNNKEEKENADTAMTENTGGSTLEIDFIDVGQGSAALLICDGQAMLIDGGPSSASNVIYAILKNRGISNLDYVIGTHPDEDHIGGLAAAFNASNVGAVYLSAAENDKECFLDVEKYAGKQNLEITVPKTGDILRLGNAEVTFLYSPENPEGGNNNSLIIRIVHGQNSILFTGDAEESEEKEILLKNPGIKSDVLCVGHHGGATSTSEKFLREVAPKYAVISCGAANKYGHPTDIVLERLKSAEVALYRTDMQGDITCVSDGENFIFETEKNANADTYLTYNKLYGQGTLPDGNEAAEQQNVTDDKNVYIINTNTGKFHYQSCKSVRDMKEKNKQEFTGTRDELIAMGYSPCGNCHP